ncbi:MAG: carboxyl transferase domain-containing protein [Acidimicrobiales bacterium]
MRKRKDEAMGFEDGPGDATVRPIGRLAIVDRGEPAMRVIHAVRERTAEGHPPTTTVALSADADRHAMFVREADEVVLLGPAAAVDPADLAGPEDHVDLDAVERALVEAEADAVWVGWGVLSDRPDLVERCERRGITFVGPDAATMRRLGDAAEVARVADEAGVPVASTSLTVDGARRLEVQVIADGHGTTWVVDVRDGSLQRQGQRVVVESASSWLDDELDRRLRDAARRLATVAGYRGAGTVSFLWDPTDGGCSVLGFEPRLSLEHPVTEATTGVDLVKLQLAVAAGARLVGDPPAPVGHAVGVRLDAVDPARGFAPAPGRVDLLRLPSGPGVRVDTGLAAGDEVPAQRTPMVAELVAWGRDRPEALARVRRAVAETAVVVRDGTTNQGFLLDLLGRPEVADGRYDATWLDRQEAEGAFVPAAHAAVAVLGAAVELAEAADDVERNRFYGWARRGRPQLDVELGTPIEVRHLGHTYRLCTWRLGPSRWRVEVDGVRVELDAERLGPHERRLRVGGRRHRLITSSQGADLLVAVDGVTHRVARDDGGIVRTPAPSVVVAIPVAEGDEVAAGDTVAVVEAMKMETALRAPFAGRVRKVLSGTNVQVDAGTPLLQLEALDGLAASSVTPPTPRLDFAGAADGGATDGRPADRRLLEWLLLGYDVPDEDVAALTRDDPATAGDLGPADPDRLADEQRLLDLFADLRSLTRPRDLDDVEETGFLGRDPNEHLNAYLRSLDAEVEGLPPRYVALLERVVAAFGLDGLERTPELEEAMYRVARSLQRVEAQRGMVLALLGRRLAHADALVGVVGDEFRDVLDRLITATRRRDPVVADQARAARHRFFDQPVLDAARDVAYAEADEHLAALAADGSIDGDVHDAHLRALVRTPRPLAPLLVRRAATAGPRERASLLEVLTRRFYRTRDLGPFRTDTVDGVQLVSSPFAYDQHRGRVVAAFTELDDVEATLAAVARWVEVWPEGEVVLVDLHGVHPEPPPAPGSHDPAGTEWLAGLGASALAAAALPASVRRVVLAAARSGEERGMSAVDLVTFARPGATLGPSVGPSTEPSTEPAADADAGPTGAFVEDRSLRGLHPMMAERLHLWRLANFAVERLPSAEDVYLFHGIGRDAPSDERLFAVAEVRDLTPVRDDHGHVVALPELEYVLGQALEGIRRFQALRPPTRRLQWNRVQLYVWPPILLTPDEIRAVVGRLTPATAGLGIEMTLVRGRMPVGPHGELLDRVLRVTSPAGSGFVIDLDAPPDEPLRPLDDYTRKVVQARRRGTVYPYELIQVLAPDNATGGIPHGDFVEHDLEEGGALVPVDRDPGCNTAGIVAGVVRTFTERYPEGMTRVALFGDPTKALGAIAEPECRRIMAALDLAERLDVPVEWFALSAGAKIAMDSGTENMDWVAAVLRRIIEFTQAGGELNVVVAGINVGAQPYWNAEATMLMHTRGILVMTPDSAMVLTGKQALEYSGAVSAEDNFGIGGYERIMGPNGQAQYWARDLGAAARLLLAHYEHGYVAPGERLPRRAATSDPVDRDVRLAPHRIEDSEFATVGDVFSAEANPERKKPFDIRSVMAAVADQDHRTMERWAAMRDADTAVVWDAHLGGWPVTLIGIESRPLVRHGPVPADGPGSWTSGTLFPMSSKKIARAINATSGSRPLVVLANLSGFDGSPESLRMRQLEFGAEIGRAVVNFDGPIVFCVVSRYHGGAFVVFSKQLNPELEALALEGSRASVIGGAPAAAVVFAQEVASRARKDPRVAELQAAVDAATGAERERQRARLAEVYDAVHAEVRGALAAEFDAVHSVERARDVGSIDAIVPAVELRARLVDAVDRGVRRRLGVDDDAAAAVAGPPTEPPTEREPVR